MFPKNLAFLNLNYTTLLTCVPVYLHHLCFQFNYNVPITYTDAALMSQFVLT